MVFIILTNENLESLKNLLKPVCLNVKSSHLTEGIARALGFGSQASLLTILEKSKKQKRGYSMFEHSTFSNWIQEKSQIIVSQILDYKFDELEQPAFKLINTQSKAVKLNMKNAWFSKCKKQNLPYIYIEKKTKYYSVHWDYISVNELHDPNKFTDEQFDLLTSLIKEYSGSNTTYYYSLMTGDIEKLEEKNAYRIAEGVFKILHGLISANSETRQYLRD